MLLKDHRDIPGFFADGDYLAVDEIVACLPRQGNLIEVGCLMGRSTTAWAESFLKAGKTYRIHAIDSFTAVYRDNADYLEGDPNLIQDAISPQRSQEELFVDFTRRYPNISYSKMRFSTEFSWDQELHCVFEDSDHQSATLAVALPFWWNKLSAGGILSGHDYHPEHQEVMDEVQRAAQQFGVAIRTYPSSSVWSLQKQ